MGDKEAIEIMKKHGMTQEEAEEFLAGTKKGCEDYKKGNMRRWSDVKKELGLD